VKGQKVISFAANTSNTYFTYLYKEPHCALLKFADCTKWFQALKYYKGLKLQKDLHKLGGLDRLTPDVTEMSSSPSESTMPTFTKSLEKLTLVWTVQEYE